MPPNDTELHKVVVKVICYTDPLCSWSWASLPIWRRARTEFGDQLTWTYRMGGMIPNWQEYSDPLNDIQRPAQMAPQWFQVRTQTGAPIDETIWLDDPPTTSYPACVAYTAANMQGEAYGEAYLYRLWEAVMTHKRNIAHRDCLVAIAEELAEESAQYAETDEALQPFDAARFQEELVAESTVAEFRQALQETHYRQIRRFPTLALVDENGKGALLVGYRPYEALAEAVKRFIAQTTVE